MVDIHKEENVFGDESFTRSGLAESRFDAANANGIAADSRSCLLTYKRRKTGKFVRDGMVWDGLEAQPFEKSISKSDQVTQEVFHAVPIGSDNSSLDHQRNVVLEQICQSLETEHDLKKCIQDALALHPGIRSRTTVKESIQSCEAGTNGTSTVSLHHGIETATQCSEGMASCESAKEPNDDTMIQLLRCTLLDIIMSENFTQLCNLLLENGIKVEKLFDLSHINSRTKEKAYESSPMQFHSDVQQMWTKLQKVGTEMVAIAKCLSDKTTSLFHEQVGSVALCISENGKHDEFHTQESEMYKGGLTEPCSLQVHSCRQCREKADGGNTLVCDSCEEMYHISCIEPAVEKIPSRSWYCADCTAKGIESPHDDCIACERLNKGKNGEEQAMHEEAPDELEESSNERDKRFSHCKVCQTVVRNDQDYRICGHSFCPHKFYHVKCLTSKQLIAYGPCWYCPSCLCRTCFIDRDDDMIVLCDGCDHAYHLYCMQPPQSAIPRGKWFCTKCSVGIQRVLKARCSYEKMLNRSKKRSVDGKLKADEGLNKSGGVDMLLNAAKTLNYEEIMLSRALNDK